MALQCVRTNVAGKCVSYVGIKPDGSTYTDNRVLSDLGDFVFQNFSTVFSGVSSVMVLSIAVLLVTFGGALVLDAMKPKRKPRQPRLKLTQAERLLIRQHRKLGDSIKK